ncbi:hypothetical protein CLU79DRAFT_771511 [Phycomyces nitens]|nr:hypothetical protein CLU79DRAFT_771511 [Phycomyces nitens]
MLHVFLLFSCIGSVTAFANPTAGTTTIVVCVSAAVFILVAGLIGLGYYLYSHKRKEMPNHLKSSHNFNDSDKEKKIYSDPEISSESILPVAMITVPAVSDIAAIPAEHGELGISRASLNKDPIQAKRRGSTASLLLLGNRLLRPNQPQAKVNTASSMSIRKAPFGSSSLSLLEKRVPKKASLRKKHKTKMIVNSLRGGVGSWKTAASSLGRKSVASVQWVSFPDLENETQKTLCVVNGESTIGKKRRLHRIPIQTTPKNNSWGKS